MACVELILLYWLLASARTSVVWWLAGWLAGGLID